MSKPKLSSPSGTGPCLFLRQRRGAAHLSVKGFRSRIRWFYLSPELNAPENENARPKKLLTSKLLSLLSKNIYLVGGIPTLLKNMSASVGMMIPNIWKVIKAMFQSPPTRTSRIISSSISPHPSAHFLVPQAGWHLAPLG